MSVWLARLKSASAPDTCAMKTTKTQEVDGNGVSVGFVACSQVNIQKSSASKSSDFASNVAVYDGTSESDADRWCWPNSPMWNQREIDTFVARQASFADKGISLDDADALGEALVNRDRNKDNRVLCLECRYLRGYRGRWHCGNWQRATMSPEALAQDLVVLLQHCSGYVEAIR